jgi:hypothetical protein
VLGNRSNVLDPMDNSGDSSDFDDDSDDESYADEDRDSDERRQLVTAILYG